MNINLKRTVVAVATTLLGIFMSWLGGFDFDHRDTNVLAGALAIVFIAGTAASYPFVD